MPENETIERAREDAREGKSPSTQAGEFVREEMHHIREGKHGARSAKQAIAIGLSKARRADEAASARQWGGLREEENGPAAIIASDRVTPAAGDPAGARFRAAARFGSPTPFGHEGRPDQGKEKPQAGSAQSCWDAACI